MGDSCFYMGTILPWSCGFAPSGWMFCNGQTLSVSQYQALFAIIGNVYGGNGTTTFQLPNLCQCAPVGAGQGNGLSNYNLATKVGNEAVALANSQMPVHNHNLMVNYNQTTWASNSVPNGSSVIGSNVTSTRTQAISLYDTTPPTVSLNPTTITPTGGNGSAVDAHENRQPYLALNYIICLEGIFPAFS